MRRFGNGRCNYIGAGDDCHVFGITSKEAPVERGVVNLNIPIGIQKRSRGCIAVGADCQGIAATERRIVALGKVDQDMVGRDPAGKDKTAIETVTTCIGDVDDYIIRAGATDREGVPCVEWIQSRSEDTIAAAVQDTRAGIN